MFLTAKHNFEMQFSSFVTFFKVHSCITIFFFDLGEMFPFSCKYSKSKKRDLWMGGVHLRY